MIVIELWKQQLNKHPALKLPTAKVTMTSEALQKVISQSYWAGYEEAKRTEPRTGPHKNAFDGILGGIFGGK
jgi:hypothetical protein